MRSLRIVATGMIAMMSFTSPAVAALITYTLSGTFTGSRDGSDFTRFATLTGAGETDDAFAPTPDITVVPLTSLSFLVDGETLVVQDATEFFVNRAEAFGGFTLSGRGGLDDVTAFSAAAFAGYDGLSDLAGIAGASDGAEFAFRTDGGSFLITDVSGIGFAASAVPEPAAWGLMILGMGAIGGAMRRRPAATACPA